MEDLVEFPRFTRTAYRAARWNHLDTAQGQGKYHGYWKFGKPRKAIWTRPLRKNRKRTFGRL